MVADQCSEVAADLLRTIKKFEIDVNDAAKDKKRKDKYLLMLKVRTLGQAMRLMWRKDKLDALSRGLDSCRKVLAAEVLLDIRDTALQSRQSVDNLSTAHLLAHNETLAALERGNGTTQSNLQSYLKRMEEETRERQTHIVTIINMFINEIRSGQLFPILPRDLCQADPSFESAALNGHTRIEDAVLRALAFRSMFVREAEIATKYKRTFDWIFEVSEAHDKPWADFQSWLQTGTGCYWIGGKAGSGKSTLMKYISTNFRTEDLLKTWAGCSQLIIGSYYFWLAGTSLQKNQEGLLRSLLSTVLSKRRDLISRVFPKLYSVLIAKWVLSLLLDDFG